MLGASAGSLISYVKYRNALGEYRKAITSTLANSNRTGRDHTNCRLKALIVCRNPEIIATFSQLFGEVGIESRSCQSEPDAIERLMLDKFEALVLDCDAFAGCPGMVEKVRGIYPNKEIVVFAISAKSKSTTAALAFGSNFMIELPLAPLQIRSLLRSVYGSMLRTSQAYFRLNVEIAVSIARPLGSFLQCQTINVSQNGMAIKTPTSLDPGELLHLVFAVPHTDIVVSAEGTVIWDDRQGKAGIRFECSSASTQSLFFEWLHGHFFMGLEEDNLNFETRHSAAPAARVTEVDHRTYHVM